MTHRKGLYVSNCYCDDCQNYREAIAIGRNQGNALKDWADYFNSQEPFRSQIKPEGKKNA